MYVSDLTPGDLGRHLTVRDFCCRVFSGVLCYMDSSGDFHLMESPFPDLKTHGPLEKRYEVISKASGQETSL